MLLRRLAEPGQKRLFPPGGYFDRTSIQQFEISAAPVLIIFLYKVDIHQVGMMHPDEHAFRKKLTVFMERLCTDIFLLGGDEHMGIIAARLTSDDIIDIDEIEPVQHG